MLLLSRGEGHGKPQNIEELYVSYVAPLKDYLYRMSGDKELASDLVQEVFYRATRAFFFRPHIEYVSAWLFKIARNLYLDYEKKRRRITEESFDKLHLEGTQFADRGSTDPVTVLEEIEIQDTIQKVLWYLPEIQRTVILLRDYQGLSYAEIADTLETTVSAVKSHLFRARVAFRETYLRISQGKGDRL